MTPHWSEGYNCDGKGDTENQKMSVCESYLCDTDGFLFLIVIIDEGEIGAINPFSHLLFLLVVHDKVVKL